MAADFNDDDWIHSILEFDRGAKLLRLRVHAKKRVRLVEVQGFMTDVEAFGLSLPEGFREMQFGEGAVIPEAMKDDIAHMNRLNFRWGCDRPVAAGSEIQIQIPASGAGKDKAVLTLTYEFPRLFGLLKGKHGHYTRMSPSAGT